MPRDAQLRGLSLALAWLAGPLVGWWPGTWLIVGQAWWWLLGAGVVSALALCAPTRYVLREPAYLVVGMLVVTLGWALRMPASVEWWGKITLWLLAGWLVASRWGWPVIRQAVVLLAWAQFPIWLAQRCGVVLWTPPPGWGTLDKRAILGTLLGLASLWSSSWRAWALALAAGLTGSWTGAVIPLARLLPVRWPHPLVWMASVPGLWVLRGWWWERFEDRWLMWQTFGWWQAHWLTGWGLQMLPGGFQDTAQFSDGIHRLPALYANSTFIDVLLHGGVIGVALLIVVLGWAAWRSARTRTLWTWVFAVWVGCWQSIGISPALLALAMAWGLSLCEPRRVDASTS